MSDDGERSPLAGSGKKPVGGGRSGNSRLRGCGRGVCVLRADASGPGGKTWKQSGQTLSGTASASPPTTVLVELSAPSRSSPWSLDRLVEPAAVRLTVPAPSGELARDDDGEPASLAPSLGVTELNPLQLLLRASLGARAVRAVVRGEDGGVGSIDSRFKFREYRTTRRFDGSLRTTCQSLCSVVGVSSSANRGGRAICDRVRRGTR